jgi:hypothetical protein
MESSMTQLRENSIRPRIGKALALAAALITGGALVQPNLARAGPPSGGGGGLHGGGFHAIGGFHGGGFAGFHGGESRADRFHDHGFDRDRFRDRRFFFGGAFVDPWWGDYPNYGYYDYAQPYSAQTWYYCSDPAGYYPYVTQCDAGWQAVPAN